MASSPVTPLRSSGLERVRRELLTSLHLGQLRPGDRVPSVRDLAGSTGMNRKTIHRAYRRLAKEGLLELKPGSGTFIADRLRGASSGTSFRDVVAAVQQCQDMADSLGLAPPVFTEVLRLTLGGGLKGLPVTLVECNQEQLGLLRLDLEDKLELDVREVLLSELLESPSEALDGSFGFVTTECHGVEVAKQAKALGVPCYRMAMDVEFPRRIAESAARGPVMMVTADASFEPVFQRLLTQLGTPDAHVARVSVLPALMAQDRLHGVTSGVSVHVSPLVEAAFRMPRGLSVIDGSWGGDPESLERLRTSLAVDVARDREQAKA